jgi:hypothetical protein
MGSLVDRGSFLSKFSHAGYNSTVKQISIDSYSGGGACALLTAYYYSDKFSVLVVLM